MTTSPPTLDVARLEVAPGVHRLILAPDGRMAALARDGGVELLDTSNGASVRTTPGLLVAGPDRDGAVVVADDRDPLQWRIGDAAFAVPDGHWTVDAGAVAASGALLALRARDHRWLVSFGPGFAVRASLDRPTDGNGVGPTVAVAADASRLFSIDVVAGVVTVAAFAGDLTPLWTTTLAPRTPEAAIEAPARPGRYVEPAPAGAAKSWGYDPAALLALTGDGAHLLAVVGAPLRSGLTDPQFLIVLDAATGAAGPTRSSKELGLVTGAVVGLAAEPASARMALLHVTSFRRGGADALDRSFDGISRLDLAGTDRADTYAPAKDGSFVPSAIAVRLDGTIVVAP